MLGLFQPEAVEWADYAYLTLNRGTTSVVFVPALPTSHRTLHGLLPLLVTLGWACNHSTRRNAILPFPDALSWQCRVSYLERYHFGRCTYLGCCLM